MLSKNISLKNFKILRYISLFLFILLMCLLVIVVRGDFTPGTCYDKARKVLVKWPVFSNMILARDKLKLGTKLAVLNVYKPDFNQLIVQMYKPNHANLDKGIFDPYIEYYEKMISLFPQLIEAHEILGYCYYQQGDLAQAISNYQQSMNKNPDFFWPYYNLAVIYFEQRKFDEIVKLFAHFNNTNHDMNVKMAYSSEVYQQIFSAHDNLAQYPVEKRLFNAYRDCNTMLIVSNYHLGHYELMGSQAAAMVKSDLNIDGSFNYYEGLAAYLFKDYALAINSFQDFIKKYPHHKNAYYYLQLSYQAMDDLESAKKLMNFVSEFDQDDPLINLHLKKIPLRIF